MCLIVDTNLAAAIFGSPPHEDFGPVRDWLDRDGCVVYGGRLAEELVRIEAVRRYLVNLRRAGRARLLPEGPIDVEKRSLAHAGLCRSNDLHVLALARVSGARTLCTHDQDLQKDFRNPQIISAPRGSIYKRNRRDHLKLLRHTGSCGRPQKRRRR